MTSSDGRRRGAAAAGVAAVLLAACDRGPDASDRGPDANLTRVGAHAIIPDSSIDLDACQEDTSGPTQITVPPTLVDRDATMQMIERTMLASGPLDPNLTVPEVAILLNRRGRAINTRLELSSGDATVDSLAQIAMQNMEFTSGYNGREPVCFWLKLKVPMPTG